MEISREGLCPSLLREVSPMLVIVMTAYQLLGGPEGDPREGRWRRSA
ncbi:MAG: hypothetical protein J7J65_02255 [Candidatus Korarchaeota archaeon]|nr:hypothetical protein [Candidatus Korarchaeota archaeon]